MDFRIKGEDLLGDDYHIASDVEVSPGEILLIPNHERLYDPRITPLNNSKVWPPWRRKAGGGFKACQGTSDYISLGGTWRLPANVRFRPSPDGKNWEAMWDGDTGPRNGFLIPRFEIDIFEYEASGEECPFNRDRGLPESNQIKIVNPWIVKTAPGWSTLLLPYLMEPSRDWSLIPGIVNTDYYHHMNWVINIYTDDEFMIPMGTPIAQFMTFPRGVQKIDYGQPKLFPLMMSLGLESPISIPIDRTGAYRREQKRAPIPEMCPVAGNQKSFKKRLFDWLFGELIPPKSNTQ
jgi:hypothetical protein